MKYKAGVALKRKIVFPLFITINVCGDKKERREKEKEGINYYQWRQKTPRNAQ